MKLKALYLLLCLLGTILPYWQFVPWVIAHHGISLSLFFQELFSTRIGAFFGIDVFVSAIVLLVFMRVESARTGTRKRWLPVLALLLVGVSLALPMFLYMREKQLEEKAPSIRP